MQKPIYMKRYFLFLFFLAALFVTPYSLQAQTGDWFVDDEDEEEMVEDDSEAWDVGPGKFDEVKIRLNGEEVELGEDYTFPKNDTLDIQVRHLAPNSGIAIHVKKGGIKLKRTSFYANEKGQLDLEVRTGGKKVKGTAILYYTPSNGTKKKIQAQVVIE